jgi:uncharacterized alpha/beta hydrolase family protein
MQSTLENVLLLMRLTTLKNRFPIARFCFLALVLATMGAGCVFSKLEKDLAKLESIAHVFTGAVVAEETDSNAIVVLALRDSNGQQIASFRMVSEAGTFDIKSDLAPTYFFAFDDFNMDLRFQANEPYGWANEGKALDPENEDTENIIISINASADNQLAFPEELIDEPLEDHVNDNVQINVGTVSSIDHPWFAEEQAKKGLWQPFAFLADGGTGIHFLQPYDPEKIPVLFVHGVNATPRTFSTIIQHLDQSRYQAWVFNYPSGLPLPSLGYTMNQFLEVLNLRYHFDELHVVAHSMGGLVSRHSINLCVQNNSCKYLRSYTTISTPWNGVASAAGGVEWAPTVVPVWRDLDPSSEFITALFETPLPDGLPHHLLFGFRQDSIFGSESSDGVISLSSQLRVAAQEQAKMVRGYDEGHVSILSNENVIGTIAKILDAAGQ